MIILPLVRFQGLRDPVSKSPLVRRFPVDVQAVEEGVDEVLVVVEIVESEVLDVDVVDSNVLVVANTVDEAAVVVLDTEYVGKETPSPAEDGQLETVEYCVTVDTSAWSVNVETWAAGIDTPIVFSIVTVDKETTVEAVFVVVKTAWGGQVLTLQVWEHLTETVEVAVEKTVDCVQLTTLQPVGVVGLILILTLVVVMVVGLTTVLTSVFVFDTVEVLYSVVGLMSVLLYLTSVFVFQTVAVLVDVDVCLIVRTAVSVTVRVFVW
jgi:hypothetical protein